jgi:hypothetical protein
MSSFERNETNTQTIEYSTKMEKENKSSEIEVLRAEEIQNIFQYPDKIAEK